MCAYQSEILKMNGSTGFIEIQCYEQKIGFKSATIRECILYTYTGTCITGIEDPFSVVESIGAIPLVMTAEEHDMAAIGISHLPHVCSALVNLVKQVTGAEDADAGSRLRNTTR